MSIEWLDSISKATLEGIDSADKWAKDYLEYADDFLMPNKKVAYLGTFALDLESSFEESLSIQVSNKAIEDSYEISANAVEKLAVINLKGIIADNSFNEPKNVFDMAGDIAGNLGERMKMLNGFWSTNLWADQHKYIAKAQRYINKANNIVEFTKGIASFKNELIQNNAVEGSFSSRSHEKVEKLRSIYNLKKRFKFECDFIYYRQMIITDLKISRKGETENGTFAVDIKLQEIKSVETEVTRVAETQFASNHCRTEQQCLKSQFCGEQVTETRKLTF